VCLSTFTRGYTTNKLCDAQQGLALLSGSKYNIYTEADLTQAAIKIVALSQEQSK
jgi:hypothetical protein